MTQNPQPKRSLARVRMRRTISALGVPEIVMPPLKTRTNKAGYREFYDASTGTWIPSHRRAAEHKLGRLRGGFHVHHRNQNKQDNRHANLLEVHPKVHARLHTHPNACARCGRDGHWSNTCYASTFWDGTPIVE